MTDELARKAIQSALSGNWLQAVRLNKEILESNPKDIAALNRLGRAYLEQGNYSSAKKAFEQVLFYDPTNPIALKNYKIVRTGKNKKPKGNANQNSSKIPLNPTLFLEETGKTKTLNLVKLGEKKATLQLRPGDEVKLVPKKRSITVATFDDIYLGKLPDDLSQKLIFFIKKGNQYQTLIRSSQDEQVKIFIREISRAPKLANQPSFSSKEIVYQASTPENLIHEEPLQIPDEEEIEGE